MRMFCLFALVVWGVSTSASRMNSGMSSSAAGIHRAGTLVTGPGETQTSYAARRDVRREVSLDVAVAPLAAPSSAPSSAAGPASGPLGAPKLPLFVDALIIPAQVSAPESGPLVIGAYRVQQKFHRDLPPTSVYAFGTSEATAASPGPTIMATRGVPLTVRWENQITDTRHLLPVDFTLGVPQLNTPGVPISVHVHGAVVMSAFDGHPDAWFTSTGETGPTFVSTEHEYPNGQSGSTLWYHDHTDGMTRLNVAAGLAGVYLVQDDAEGAMGLPSGPYDVPLMLQDKSFDMRTGMILFPAVGDVPHLHPVWFPEYFGDYLLVNGKVSPYMEVENTMYRFRIVNGANARFFDLRTYPAMNFSQVATDSGFLSEPLSISHLLIGPGERAELLLDFSNLAEGTEVYLTNSAPTPYVDGDPPVAPYQTWVMKFIVTQGLAVKVASVPVSLAPFFALNPADATTTRTINMTEKENNENGQPETSVLEGLHWKDPVDVKAEVGATEVWTVINLTDDWHTFHIHLVPHQLVQRQPFDKESYLAGNCSLNGTEPTCFTGPPVPASGAELSWKDTTLAPAGYVTTLIIRFQNTDNTSFPFDATQDPGYVFHCHILDHEDNDMMRPYVLVNPGYSTPKAAGRTSVFPGFVLGLVAILVLCVL